MSSRPSSNTPSNHAVQPGLQYDPKPAHGKNAPAPVFESWGRYPRFAADVTPVYWTTDFPLARAPLGRMLPVGMGRSYGDSCLLEDGTLIATRALDRLLSFNPETGPVALRSRHHIC